MIAYGWKYAYRDFSSETFASREPAVKKEEKRKAVVKSQTSTNDTPQAA